MSNHDAMSIIGNTCGFDRSSFWMYVTSFYRIVLLLPYTVFQIYYSAGNRPNSKCVCKIA